MQAYLAEYLPILIFLAIAVGLAAIILLASLVVARQSPDREKLSAYECGFEPFERRPPAASTSASTWSPSCSSSSTWRWRSCSRGR